MAKYRKNRIRREQVQRETNNNSRTPFALAKQTPEMEIFCATLCRGESDLTIKDEVGDDDECNCDNTADGWMNE